MGIDGKVKWTGHPDPADPTLDVLIERELAKVKRAVPEGAMKRDGLTWHPSKVAFEKARAEKKLVLLYKDWPR